RGDEGWIPRRAFRQLARPEAHSERAPRLAESDVKPSEACAVLALERNQVPADVEHRDGQWSKLALARGCERNVDDRARLGQRECCHSCPRFGSRPCPGALMVAPRRGGHAPWSG